jgi:hypothetical protein
VKRIFVAFLIITLLVLGITPAFASQTARNISIFEVEGSDVTMTKGTSKSLPVKTGLKLGSGSTVTTGNNSYCWLLLDDETLVKIDQKSKIQIGKASGDRLSISVLSGAITVDAAAQKGKQSLNVNAGNSALAIRGTLFVVEYTPDKDVMITMLTGSGDVNGNILLAGQTMFIYDQQTGKIHEVQDFNVADSLSRVVMETILSHMDDLINSGVISSGEAENLTEQLEQRIEDRRTEEAAADAAAESSVANMNLDNNVVQRTEEAPPAGGGGGSGVTAPYVITFDLNGDFLVDELNQNQTDVDALVLALTIPGRVRANNFPYTLPGLNQSIITSHLSDIIFSGWWDDDSNDYDVGEVISTAPSTHMTLYARWGLADVVITFDLNGDFLVDELNQDQLAVNALISALASTIPDEVMSNNFPYTLPGLNQDIIDSYLPDIIFSGWQDDDLNDYDAGEIIYTAPSTPMILYARWEW